MTVSGPPPAPSGAVIWERVLEVRHWTDRLFSFRLTRPPALRFRSGEFVMIGLVVDGKPLLRAYSIASPAWDDALDFYSIKVPDGPLTSRLQSIQVGDYVLLGKKPTGTLVLDALTPGERLYLFSTGTGIAPFASLIRDPETYERFGQVVLTHTCRDPAELAYGAHIVQVAREDPLVGEAAAALLVHYPTVTRGEHPVQGRITDHIADGRLFAALACERLDPARDRAMICGSRAMTLDLKAAMEAHGLAEGSLAHPGHFVIERAFVD